MCRINFLWVEDETTFDNANVKKDRLYELEINMTSGGNNFTMSSTQRPIGATMKAEIPGIANTARYSDNDQRLLFSFGDKSLYATERYTDASLFSMFKNRGYQKQRNYYWVFSHSYQSGLS